MMVSFAQNHEDVLLDRLFPRDHRGTYIDVGANHPLHCSVTKHFYDQGWSGINIEPGSIFSQLSAARPRDINLQVAVSDKDGEAEFCEFPGRTTDSMLLSAMGGQGAPPDAMMRRIPIRSLATICAENIGGRTIDFLSVDVEGHEEAVLRGADWVRWRPRVVVVEATRPHSRELTDLSWEPILLRAGYLFAIFDGLNRFYVREEDRQLLPLLQAPVCIFDEYLSLVQVLSRQAQWRQGAPSPEVLQLLGAPQTNVFRNLPLMPRLVKRLTQRFPHLAHALKRARCAFSRRAA